MAPVNRTVSKVTLNVKKPAVSSENDTAYGKAVYSKRKAEHSPPKNGNIKRPALNTINNLQLINNGKATKVKSIIKSEKTCLTEKANLNKPSIAPGPETRAKRNRFASGIRLQGPFAGNNVTKTRPSNVNPVSPVPNSSRDLKSKSRTRSTAIANGVQKIEQLASEEKKPCSKCPEESAQNEDKVKIRRSLRNIARSVENENGEGKKPALNTINNLQLINNGKATKVKSIIKSEKTCLTEKANLNKTSIAPGPETRAKLTRFASGIGPQGPLAGNNVTKSRPSNVNPVSPVPNSSHDLKPKSCTRSTAVAKDVQKIEQLASEEKKTCSKCPEESAQNEDKVKIRRSLRNIAKSVENENGEGKKPIRKSSTRYSLTRKSLSVDLSTENGSLYISAVDITLAALTEQPKNKKDIYSELSEFDRELIHDPHQVSLYAMEIFEYLKSREVNFQISDYMCRQPYINKRMRATLVDWMVEVQENFELNHETLYLAVKLVDLYLQKVKIHSESLQLVGAAALFLSCKYDERLSPSLDDFIYIGDGAYDQNGLLAMEQSILKHINFELSIPISYSFLRRYARCARIQMPLLTLARYILELGLVDYSTVTLSDSKKAAAALYLAFRMVKHSHWTDALVYYTGYKLSDFKDIVLMFNRMLHQKPAKEETTIRNKYSHELFFKVAETPLIQNEELHLDA